VPEYREPLDSQLERELLEYTLDTGSSVVRELKPLLYPIANNALTARHLFAKHERECREWRRDVRRDLDELKAYNARIQALEDAEEITGVEVITELKKQNAELRDEGKRWKWWALGIIGSVLGAGGSASLGYFIAR
jgi:hypothetical protein